MQYTCRNDPRQIDLVEWLEINREALDEIERQQAPRMGPDTGVSDMPAMVPGTSPHVCGTFRDGEEEWR